MTSRLRRIWHPAVYQGGRVARRYFEGWYFKQVDAREREVLAVIPGVSYSADGKSKHAFVQIVSRGRVMHYFAYPIESFGFDANSPFTIRIGDNVFTESGMTLRLQENRRR